MSRRHVVAPGKLRIDRHVNATAWRLLEVGARVHKLELADVLDEAIRREVERLAASAPDGRLMSGRRA